MKVLKFLFTGLFFGIVLIKGQVISWYRIYEMFRFESFHMYGIIGSAVVLGAISILIIKKRKLKDIKGEEIHIAPKKLTIFANLAGGTIFGFGWAMTGACPGPMFALVGSGSLLFVLVILMATLGTFVYGLIKHKLPH